MNKFFKFFSKNIRFVFLLAYLGVEFVRYGGSIDFNQFLFYYLSIVNTVVCTYIILNNDLYKHKLKSVLKNKFFIIYFSFIIWGGLSYLYALNTSEVLVKSSVWITSFIVFFNCYLLFDRKDFKPIVYLLSIILLLEVYSSFSAYWELSKYIKYDFSRNSLLRGVTGNRNLTTLIFCMKIPFLVYWLNSSKNKYIKLFIFLALIWTVYTLILLGSRSSYIYYGLVILISIIYTVFIYNKSVIENFKRQYILISFLIALGFYSLFIGNTNSSSINNRISSIDLKETSTQQRLRFYSHGINHIINNPVIGVGLGNWKIKSIDYDSENMFSYVVPYYLHNDFLEAGTELGLIGLLLYLGLFLYLLLKLLLMIINDIKNNKDSMPKYILFLSILVYFIDSNLNFPHGRAISQNSINIIFALSLILINENETK